VIYIESLQNERIKKLVHWLNKPAMRKRDQIFLVEGEREISRAIRSGYDLKDLFISEESELTKAFKVNNPIMCSKEVFAKLVIRRGTVRSLAVFSRPNKGLADLKLSGNPFILILDGIEKPGNIGALMRTANAVAVDAVVFSSLKCDPLSSHSIRNSLGGIFNTPWFESNTSDVQNFLSNNNLKSYLMDPNGKDFSFDIDLDGPCAIVLGSEDQGLGESWKNNDLQKLKIPMNGIVDSLNVSVAGAVMLYEVLRQRRLPKSQ
jgi:TrmH family RNA methyltransferase|tara:strand:+ start:2361 stop:3146 length:786 start_codon:yes stop_codon:yes gene_type:complete